MKLSEVPVSETMPSIICANSLESVRKYPNVLGDWYQGRARASALIHPTPENIGAANEITFLTGDYSRRHYG